MSPHVDPVAEALQAEPADDAAKQEGVSDQGRSHGAGGLRPLLARVWLLPKVKVAKSNRMCLTCHALSRYRSQCPPAQLFHPQKPCFVTRLKKPSKIRLRLRCS